MITCENCALRECAGHNGTIVCDLDGESHEPDYTCDQVEPEEEKEYKLYVVEVRTEHPEEHMMAYEELRNKWDDAERIKDIW